MASWSTPRAAGAGTGYTSATSNTTFGYSMTSGAFAHWQLGGRYPCRLTISAIQMGAYGEVQFGGVG